MYVPLVAKGLMELPQTPWSATSDFRVTARRWSNGIALIIESWCPTSIDKGPIYEAWSLVIPRAII